MLSNTYYSTGGGTVVEEADLESSNDDGKLVNPPFPFSSSNELLDFAETKQIAISSIMLANELSARTEPEVTASLAALRQAMLDCIEQGSSTVGTLPGGLRVKRRAPVIAATLKNSCLTNTHDSLGALDWVNLWALAVNEENAAGGRVVTAPTNGAAGIVPAVMCFYLKFVHEASALGANRFLLTAAAIGSLFKENASISGAEVGCQGEVGVACSMAAAGLTEVMGGSPAQVENAAEIAMEHCLGLTCDRSEA